jgi:hypothetical protein
MTCQNRETESDDAMTAEDRETLEALAAGRSHPSDTVPILRLLAQAILDLTRSTDV